MRVGGKRRALVPVMLGPSASSSRVSAMLDGAVVPPGSQMSTSVSVSMHWESVVRQMDEMFMKDQMCLSVNGRVDLALTI